MEYDFKSIAIIVVVLILTLGAIIGGILLAVRRIENQKIEKISSRKKALLEINDRYFFYKLQPKKVFYANVETKAKYDRFSFNEYMMSIIERDRKSFDDWISKAEFNIQNYQRYLQEVDGISTKRIKKEARIVGVTTERFRDYENILIKNNMLVPETQISAVCKLSYSSPKGRNRYSSEMQYTLDDLKWLSKRIYEQKEYRSTAAWERAQMTPTLRYRILQRDGFRCQLCGLSAGDGVKLHVDHIVPVSKGGKTIESNLRTLCDRCNQGKGSRYDPQGVN